MGGMLWLASTNSFIKRNLILTQAKLSTASSSWETFATLMNLISKLGSHKKPSYLKGKPPGKNHQI